MKWVAIVIVVLVVVSGGLVYKLIDDSKLSKGKSSASQEQMVIGFLMASNSSERWVQDRTLFVERAEALGAKVRVLEAGVDADLQERQAENLILQGVNVLVVVAQDGERASAIIDKAHAAGIKVIAYDRLIKNPALDYYISFDSVKVGESAAQGVVNVVNKGTFAYVGGSKTDTNAYLVQEGAFNVLQPLIDNGDIELVYNDFTEDWKPEIAYAQIKNLLDDGVALDAVVAANDGTASGVIRALEEKGLAGKVPVSGQDASLAAVQFVANGKQTVTVYKPIKALAEKSAEVAIAIIKGEPVVTNSTIENGAARTPAILLDVVSVTKDTIDSTVIKDGFRTREEIYGE
jgi:D-xylose transport system substrate-binding protein